MSVSWVRLFLSFMTVGALVFPALTGAQAPPSVTLTASRPSGQPVGASVLWTAVVSNGGTALPLYQFSVQDPAGTWKVIRDFSLLNVFPWTTLDEGAYTIAVRVYDKTLATTYGTTMAFQFSSRIVANTPAVSPTTHPLVALYSAPPCSGGVQVYFQAPGKSGLLNTPVKSCQPGKSVNFYIAGLYPSTTYQMQQVTGTPANLTQGHRPVAKLRQTAHLQVHSSFPTLVQELYAAMRICSSQCRAEDDRYSIPTPPRTHGPIEAVNPLAQFPMES